MLSRISRASVDGPAGHRRNAPASCREIRAQHRAEARIEADESHVGQVRIGDQPIQPVLPVGIDEFVAVGLRQERHAELVADREHGNIGLDALPAGHHDGVAVVAIEAAANGLDAAVGDHRKEFRRRDRHRAVDAVFDPVLRHHVAFAELELNFQQALQPAPIGPDERLCDRMREPRHRADAPAPEHLLLGADVEDALEVDQTADEVGNAPHRLAKHERDRARAGVDGVDGNVGRRFRTAEHDDPASLGDHGIVVFRRMQDAPALRLERSSPGR